jgi:hypothetical protein
MSDVLTRKKKAPARQKDPPRYPCGTLVRAGDSYTREILRAEDFVLLGSGVAIVTVTAAGADSVTSVDAVGEETFSVSKWKATNLVSRSGRYGRRLFLGRGE